MKSPTPFGLSWQHNQNPPQNVYEIVEMFEGDAKPYMTYILAPSPEAAEFFWFEYTKGREEQPALCMTSLVHKCCWVATQFYDGSVDYEQL